MNLSYQKLWEHLSKLGMTTEQLRSDAKITQSAITKMKIGEAVTLETLAKICGVLCCQLGDIIEIGGASVPFSLIPDVSFEWFDNSEQFETLGLSCLYDLKIPLTQKSVQSFLVSNYRNCSLSLGACKELLSSLADEEIIIDFPSDIEPDINELPQTINTESEDDAQVALARQKIGNYLDWILRKYTDSVVSWHDTADKINSCNSDQQTITVEKGTLYAPINGADFTFRGVSQSKVRTVDIFPINLVHAILGDGSYYIFDSRIQDLKNYVDELLNCCSPSERLILLLHYKYGLRGKDLVDYFELPKWQSLVCGFENSNVLTKALRKLRHPRRNKKLRQLIYRSSALSENTITSRYNHFTPYRSSVCGLPTHTAFLSDIKREISNGLVLGQPLAEILSAFYQDEVVSDIQRNVGKWFQLSTIPLDELGLSWTAYYSLSNAKISSISEIWEAHGKDISLTDYESSGLRRVIGLDSVQIKEILNVLSTHVQVPETQECIDSLIDYAETIAVDDPEYDVICGETYLGRVYFNGLNDDFLSCTEFVPDHVLCKLLRLKYRQWSSVISDYNDGVLQDMLSKTEDEVTQNSILQTIDMLCSGEYPVTHYVFDSHWDSIMEGNPCKTLQDIRKMYVQGLPVKYNFKEFELIVPTLFPARSEGFPLLYNTRTGNMQWFTCTTALVKPLIRRLTIVGNVLYEVTAVSIGFSSDTWVAAEVVGHEVEHYFFKVADDGQLLPHTCFNDLSNSVFCAIDYCSKLNRDPRRATDDWNEKFVQVQTLISNFYANDKEEEISSYYSSYINQTLEKESSSYNFSCMSMNIDELDFGIITFNMLKRMGVKTVADIVNMSGENLSRLQRRMKSFDEVQQKLYAMRLDFQNSPTDMPLKEEKPTDSRYVMTIDELDLSVRAFNCLRRAGIFTVGDLVSLSSQDLFKIRNMGKKPIDEVQKKLEMIGLSLAEGSE